MYNVYYISLSIIIYYGNNLYININKYLIMSHPASDIEDFLSEISECEIRILCIILARIGGSPNRNFIGLM